MLRLTSKDVIMTSPDLHQHKNMLMMFSFQLFADRQNKGGVICYVGWAGPRGTLGFIQFWKVASFQVGVSQLEPFLEEIEKERRE